MTDLSHIYKKLHENRWYHVEQARKARDMQAALANIANIKLNTVTPISSLAFAIVVARIAIEPSTRSEPADTPDHQDQKQSE